MSQTTPMTRRGGPIARVLAATPPPALLIVSIVSIQVGAAVAIHLFDTLGSTATAFLRVAFAGVLLLATARPRVTGLGGRTVGLLLAFGVGIGAMNMCFYGAIARIPLGLAVAIEFVGPLGVAVLTSRRPRDFAWIGLAIVGLLLLTPEIGNGLDPLGVGLALAAGLGWANFILLSPRVARAVGNGGLALAMATAGVFMLPFALAVGGLEQLDAVSLGAAIAVAVLSTAFPISLEFEALRRMSALAYGITVTLEPAVAALVGAVVLAQVLPPTAIVAIACVTAAAVGVTLTDRRAPVQEPL